MLIIQTRSSCIFSKENLKWKIKRIIGRKDGPMSVFDSLIRGLNEIGFEYKINKKPNKGDLLIVLSGSEALKEAIEYKKRGLINRLIAGPNIYTSPIDNNKIICSSEIDSILVPAEWVSDLWAFEAPEIQNKLKVWPAGVKISNASTRNGPAIVYNKIKGSEECKKIEGELNKLNINFKTFEYRNFKQVDFFDSLSSSPFMIYISKSESQGLAIQEAWARNVPTLVLKSKGYYNNGKLWINDKINAPYLNENLGFFFNNTQDLGNLILKLKDLNPKKYCDENLSDLACAKKLIELI